MSPEDAASAIRQEAMRRYTNDTRHHAQARMAADLITQPPNVSEQARQLVRTGALLASSLALVVADEEFMRGIRAQVVDGLSDELRKQLVGFNWTTDTQPDLH